MARGTFSGRHRPEERMSVRGRCAQPERAEREPRPADRFPFRIDERTPDRRRANVRLHAAVITSSDRCAMSWNCWGVCVCAAPFDAPEKGCEWTMT